MLCKWRYFLLYLMLPVIAGCIAAPEVRYLAVDRPSWETEGPVCSQATEAAAASEIQPAALREPLPPPVAEGVPVPKDTVELQALSLADLEAIAFQNNPTLVTAAARLQAAHGRQIQAGLMPNPVVGYTGNEIGTQATAGSQGGFVRQQLITAGKLRLDWAIAAREASARHFEFNAQEQRVLTDVQIRFFEALAAQQRVELTEELVRIGAELAGATETLLENGQVSANDLLQAEIREENARILHDNARNENVEALRRLAAVIGVPNLPAAKLEGELVADSSPLVWEDSYHLLVAGHPEVNAAQARVERAKIALVRSRKEPIPNVEVSVAVLHQNPTGDDIANVQIGLPLPVFDKNQGNILAAEAELVAATREVERSALALQDRLAVTFRQYANAHQQVQRYIEKIVPKAERSLQLVTQGYGKGQVEYLTLLTAQQTYVEVSLASLDALRDLRVTTAMLEGKLLSASLDERLSH